MTSAKEPAPGPVPTNDVAAMRRYAELQYAFVQFLTEHLTDCRRTFGGDLDAVLVLAVLGQIYIRGFLSAPTSGAPTTGMTSASRIADVTGMPRETVRRKLLAFQKAGWIVQGDDGSWGIVGPAGRSAVRKDLSDLDQRGMARVMRLHGELCRLLAKQNAEDR